MFPLGRGQFFYSLPKIIEDGEQGLFDGIGPRNIGFDYYRDIYGVSYVEPYGMREENNFGTVGAVVNGTDCDDQIDFNNRGNIEVLLGDGDVSIVFDGGRSVGIPQ